MGIRRRTFILVFVLAAALVATGVPTHAASMVPSLGGRVIKVATDATYPPFEMLDKNKKIIGYDIDLMNEVCRLANCKPQIRSAAWDGIFPALQKGDYDVVISGVTITAERDKIVDFTIPYMEVGQVVLVRKSESRIKGVDDLKGMTVAVQRGTTNDETATQMQKAGKLKAIKRFPTFDLAVRSLLQRDVDAVIIDNTSASGYMGVNPDKLKVAGPKFTNEGLGIVVRQGDKTLQTAFNAALKELKANGTLDRLFEKWFVKWKA